MKYFNVEIKGGKFLMDRGNFLRSIESVIPGKYLMVLIRIDNERTERDWQKLYRVILKEMCLDTGYDPNTMHELAKAEVLKQMNVISTTELDASGWKEYFEKLGDWSFEKFNFVI